MNTQEPPSDPGSGAAAQSSADRLALALEEVGFDVGRAFPMLSDGTGRDGAPVVELGRVTVDVAAQLSQLLTRAVGRGVALATG